MLPKFINLYSSIYGVLYFFSEWFPRYLLLYISICIRQCKCFSLTRKLSSEELFAWTIWPCNFYLNWFCLIITFFILDILCLIAPSMIVCFYPYSYTLLRWIEEALMPLLCQWLCLISLSIANFFLVSFHPHTLFAAVFSVFSLAFLFGLFEGVCCLAIWFVCCGFVMCFGVFFGWVLVFCFFFFCLCVWFGFFLFFFCFLVFFWFVFCRFVLVCVVVVGGVHVCFQFSLLDCFDWPHNRIYQLVINGIWIL